LYLLCILVLGRIVSPPKLIQQSEEQRLPFRVVLRSLINERLLLGLTISLTFFWLSNNGRQQFETLYMKQLGASDQLIGWAYTYPALLELPIMLWADRLARKYGSGKILSASILIEGVSLLAIVFAPSMSAMLFLRAASGLYYSFYAIASVAYAVENAPAGQAATILSLYYITLNSIIGLVTAPISGAIFDRLGAYPLYIIAAIGTFMAWLALVISQKKPASKPEQVL
jgi:PPP family 3-phenylpropionic acid transporter